MIKQEYWAEACGLLSLSETEQKLAEKLLDGPRELEAAFQELNIINIEETVLSPVFGYTGGNLFLYPVFISFINGELPDSRNGALPDGMTLEFPEKREVYGAEELLNEMTAFLSGTENGGAAFILAGKDGTGFLTRQAAYRLARPVLFWNGDSSVMNELLLTAALYDAFVCLDLRSKSSHDPEHHINGQRSAAAACGAGLALLVLTELAEEASEITAMVPGLMRKVPVPDAQTRLRYISDHNETKHFLNKNQCTRLAGEPFSIGRLNSILSELELEERLQNAETDAEQRSGLQERAFVRILARCKQAEADTAGIRRMEANRKLTDLCLPEEQSGRLRNICRMLKNRDKVMHQWGFQQKYSYGNGISILLYGMPGTGKTMAAQVIAAELNMPLYRVDLSALISKYIGETQKNIARIFDQAKQLDGILLFDEADALFSRRNEVSDAQDKYANAETAYLLQRIEESDGICILTTNLLQNFDEAFRRRITYMIHFPMPDAKLRRQIWEGVFPSEAPVETDVDFGLLAENFELSGAAIRNAAMQSAWNASVNEQITMQDILGGIENEYRKMNRALKPEQKALIERYMM